MRKTCLTLSSSDQESVLEFVKYVFEFHGLVSIIAFLRMDVITDPYDIGYVNKLCDQGFVGGGRSLVNIKLVVLRLFRSGRKRENKNG